MLLQLSTWQEIDTYLETSKGIIIPIGSTEQHGPMGFIGTDAVCPEKIAHEFSQKTGVLVAPTISYGVSQHHLGFSGSITLRPATLIAVVRDIVQSLAVHGFTHMVFLNGHGGNVSPLNAAFAEIYSDFSLRGVPCSIHCGLVNWYEGKRVKALIETHFKESEGSHATPGEVSLSFHAHPDAVKTAVLDPAVAPDGDFRDAADFRRKFPDGRMGSNSALATPEIGAEFCNAAVEDLAESFQAFSPAG